jgi:hypothetical protein
VLRSGQSEIEGRYGKNGGVMTALVGVWEIGTYMVSILVSVSVPITVHNTTPCLESRLVSDSGGAVAAKMLGAPALGTPFLR